MQWQPYSIPITEWRMSRVSLVSGDSWHRKNRTGIYSQMKKRTSWSRVHRDETNARVGKTKRSSLMNSCPRATSGETNWAMIWELQSKLRWTPTVNLYLIRTSSQTTRSPVTLKETRPPRNSSMLFERLGHSRSTSWIIHTRLYFTSEAMMTKTKRSRRIKENVTTQTKTTARRWKMTGWVNFQNSKTLKKNM